MSRPLRVNRPPRGRADLSVVRKDERLTELRAYATEVLGDAESAHRWLDTGLWELGNLSPNETVAREGDAGLVRARDVLLRIEYGVYS
jgi:uncharacterized protein (DUF2384 family)